MEKPKNHIRMKWCPIDFIQFNIILQNVKNLGLHWLLCSVRRINVTEEEFLIYWAEGNWNCNHSSAVHHFVFSITPRPGSPELSLPLRKLNWRFVFISNFSSQILLSHLSHRFSVHRPPQFNAQFKSCSSSLCSFSIHLIPPLISKQISTSVTVPAQYFRV
jgi:hypothetical protein